MLLQDSGDGDVGAVPGDQRGGAAQRVRGAHEQHHDHHQRGTVFNNFNIVFKIFGENTVQCICENLIFTDGLFGLN